MAGFWQIIWRSAVMWTNLLRDRLVIQARRPGGGVVCLSRMQHLPHVLSRVSFWRSAVLRALVVTVGGLVHCLTQSYPVDAGEALREWRVADAGNAASQPAVSAPEAGRPKQIDLEDLPLPVQEMRDAILVAVESGDIDELRTAIEWNELRPEFQVPREEDPIEYWRKNSKDGEGEEILEILGQLLEAGPASLPIGRDFENNAVYVWPYLSEVQAKSLSDDEKTELARLMPKEKGDEFAKTGKWPWYRLAIGADGTWHIFSKSAE